MRWFLGPFLFATLPALAAPQSAQPTGAVTAAPDGGVVIAAPPCAELVAGAAYVPGLDAAGNPVAPADLPDAGKPKIDTPAIEINARLAGRFGSPATGARLGRAILGFVTVRDGRAYFNGEPLAPDASDAMIAACRAQK